MIESKGQNENALDAFGKIKQLASFSGEENDFWIKYAQCCSAICRSPLALVLKISDDQWLEQSFFSNLDISETIKDNLIKQSLSLLHKIKDKPFIFEPTSHIWDMPSAFIISFKVYDYKQESFFLVTIVCNHSNLDRFNDVVVRTQLLSTIYNSYLNYQKSHNLSMTIGEGNLVYALELLDDVINKKDFLLACMTLVNDLVNKFECSKVSIGFLKKSYIKTVAISHTETFDKSSDSVLELETLFEESADQEQRIIIPDIENQENLICHSHKTFHRSKGLTQLISIPMYLNQIAVGVVTIECLEDSLEKKDIELISIAINQVTPWLEHLYQNSLWFGTKLFNKFKDFIAWWFGPNKSLLKLSIITFIICIILSFFIKIDYKLEASATLETDNVAYLSSPFHGFIKEVLAHSGDIVKKGEILISLDTEELELKELEENANIIRYTREMEKARSNRKLVDMKVALARVKQSQAELTRIKYYVNQSKVKSPLDGVIVDGDKVELLGSPVSKGDLLLKVANSSSLHLKIKLNEQDIDFVDIDALGELKLISQPDQVHPIIIKKIIPIAQLDIREGNIFYLKASLLKKPQKWWRPGMSGVVYINAGKRPIIWIFLHKTIDALRMKLWL
ncbi:MAG: hypothetical protein COB02_10465 [Candidatus Cloacimonadota bacterium]|nr:MAG: hypothetical protein COB02_10465 [Candidatus Cloacimonadota bacterium]